MALRWLTVEQVHDACTRLARLHRWKRGWCDVDEYAHLLAEYGEDYSEGDRPEEQRRIRAYYIKRLGNLADTSRRVHVPSFVR